MSCSGIASRRPLVRASALLLLAACAGCAGGSRYTSTWDGRRGYDGKGDYGYDLNASRAEAGDYGARASKSYPVPGTREDPWGPYIHEAAARFAIPERWIRGVMRQESGGHLLDSSGGPITSWVGAMGLMQVMPATYDMLRGRYGLGSDPYEPHDNIMAGAAYIREMYDRFGAPGFLAAYNAGPDRLDSYLNGGVPLPDETVNYLASVAPRLGNDVRMTGPLAAYAGIGAGTAYAAVRPSEPQGGAPMSGGDGAYAGGGMVSGDPQQTASAADEDPADRAFDGGGLVTADAPTGRLTGYRPPAAQPAPRPVYAQAQLPQPRSPTVAVVPVALVTTQPGGWAIQVGAYPDAGKSTAAIAAARTRAGDLLARAQPAITTVQRGALLYRARLTGLSSSAAAAACARLTGQGLDCFTVPPAS
jgi:hypothetical protein